MTDKQKEAIERLKSIDESTEEYDGNLFKTDFETVLNLIQEQQKDINTYKKTIEDTLKIIEDNEMKDKIIDLMSEQLTTPVHSKEWVKEYYERKSENGN